MINRSCINTPCSMHSAKSLHFFSLETAIFAPDCVAGRAGHVTHPRPHVYGSSDQPTRWQEAFPVQQLSLLYAFYRGFAFSLARNGDIRSRRRGWAGWSRDPSPPSCLWVLRSSHQAARSLSRASASSALCILPRVCIFSR